MFCYITHRLSTFHLYPDPILYHLTIEYASFNSDDHASEITSSIEPVHINSIPELIPLEYQRLLQYEFYFRLFLQHHRDSELLTILQYFQFHQLRDSDPDQQFRQRLPALNEYFCRLSDSPACLTSDIRDFPTIPSTVYHYPVLEQHFPPYDTDCTLPLATLLAYNSFLRAIPATNYPIIQLTPYNGFDLRYDPHEFPVHRHINFQDYFPYDSYFILNSYRWQDRYFKCF